MTKHQRYIEITEHDSIQTLDIVFGFGPAAPFVIGFVAAWCFAEPWRLIALQLTSLWASAILIFLAGVRRGLSFRTESGPTKSQMMTMLSLYCLGLSSLVALWLDQIIMDLVLLLISYSTVFVLDPIAARRGEAPLFFSRLRRLQMSIIMLALAACIFIAIRT